jgi:hypothetical protein
MESTTVITRNCAIAAGCARHDANFPLDSLRSLVGLAAGPGLPPGFHVGPGNVGLPCPLPPGRAPGKIGRAGHSGTLPRFRPVADVPGLPPGWSLGKRCRRAPGWSRSACRRASRRAGLPARCRAGHSGSVADVRRATSGFRPSLGKRCRASGPLPTCRASGPLPGWSLGGRCRASGLPPGFHVGPGNVGLPAVTREAQGNGQGGCLARANRKLLARLRPSLPCGAWGIDSQEEGT